MSSGFCFMFKREAFKKWTGSCVRGRGQTKHHCGADQVFLLEYYKCQYFEEYSLGPFYYSTELFYNIQSGGEWAIGDSRGRGSSYGGAAGL